MGFGVNILVFAVQKDSNRQDGDSEISSLEKLAKQRDYKRRRQTYRAKNVHITKRSTVEVNMKYHLATKKFLHTLRLLYLYAVNLVFSILT